VAAGRSLVLSGYGPQRAARLRAGGKSWPWPLIGAVSLVTAVGGALRFVGLAHQGFWYDEAHTVLLVELTPGRMLSQLPVHESTPPLYYVCAWVWARAFGLGEAGLRSLSALVGTATVPVGYLIGRRLGSRRAGLVAASLLACNPLLVWYSQEARAYALLVLLSAVGFLFFLVARERPAAAPMAGWAVASALALATHYLAAVTIAPEAVLLLLASCQRAIGWVFIVAATGATLLPLALTQRATHLAAWIGRIPLGVRLRQLGDQLVAGFGASRSISIAAGVGLILAVPLLARARPAERRNALLAAGVGAAGLALALGLVGLGVDELITRNLLTALVPLVVAVAVVLGGSRAGLVGLAATVLVCGAWVGVNLAVAHDPGLQRPDWRLVLRALGPAQGPRLIVLEHYRPSLPVALYDRRLRRLPRSSLVFVREVDVVAAHGAHGRSCWWGASCNLSRARIAPTPPRGMRTVARLRIPDFRIARYAAARPLPVSVATLRRELGHVGVGAVLFEPASARALRKRAAPEVSSAVL
jgi:mannosyltransferase